MESTRAKGCVEKEALERGLSNLLVQMRQLEPGIRKLSHVNNNLVGWNRFFSQLLTATSMQRSATDFADVTAGAGKENHQCPTEFSIESKRSDPPEAAAAAAMQIKEPRSSQVQIKEHPPFALGGNMHFFFSLPVRFPATSIVAGSQVNLQKSCYCRCSDTEPACWCCQQTRCQKG